MDKPASSKKPPRKPYSSPKLVRYGEVRKLTQGSTMGSAEGAAMLASQMLPSDRALKQDWVRIGTHPFGVGLYLFDYKPEFRDRHGHGRQFGVMADEVERVLPAAVTRDCDGYRRVDYAMLGIRGRIS